MPAKATVPVEAFPCIHRFRGMGPSYKDRRLDPDGWMRPEL